MFGFEYSKEKLGNAIQKDVRGLYDDGFLKEEIDNLMVEQDCETINDLIQKIPEKLLRLVVPEEDKQIAFILAEVVLQEDHKD